MKRALFAPMALVAVLVACGARVTSRAPDGGSGTDSGTDSGPLECPDLPAYSLDSRPRIPSGDGLCEGEPDCTIIEYDEDRVGCPNTCECVCVDDLAYELGCTRIFCGDMPNVCGIWAS